jgi:ABC-type transport system involved in cytochrome c biogenesis ATPase subunit
MTLRLCHACGKQSDKAFAIKINGTNLSDITFEQGDIVFVKSSNQELKQSFLHFLAGLKALEGLELFSKKINHLTCNKSYQSRGRLFIDGDTIYKGTAKTLANLWLDAKRFAEFALNDISKISKRFNAKPKPFNNYIYKPTTYTLQSGKTTWQNIARLASLANQPEMTYPIVYYFNLEDYLELKISAMQADANLATKLPLISLSAAMAFSQMDLWILNLAPELILEEQNLKITKHLITSRAEDSDGIVFYSTHANEPLDFKKQHILDLY